MCGQQVVGAQEQSGKAYLHCHHSVDAIGTCPGFLEMTFFYLYLGCYVILQEFAYS